MPRNLIHRIVCDAEPMLAGVYVRASRQSWLPAAALEARSLDVTRWQTRAARGISWHCEGHAFEGRHIRGSH
jgi:hypothetical protein